MEFFKLNFMKKFNEVMPIGLCNLGLSKNSKIKTNNKYRKNRHGYPCFFQISKVLPVVN
ncbi:hypothetical protein IJG14_02480 [bacterium]|nr:hypothetical protein [bacterium]